MTGPFPAFAQDAFAADAFQGEAYDPATPRLAVRVDWGAEGHFSSALADVTPDCWAPAGATWTRGRSSDFSVEAKGAASFTLLNLDGRYTADRNWCDNPSFERDLAGWVREQLPGYPNLITSLARVPDAAPGAGSWCLEAVADGSATDQGFLFRLPYRFRAGVTYSVAYAIRTTGAGAWLQWGFGSAAGDRAAAIVFPSLSWATQTLAWTPTADRTDVCLWFCTWAAAAIAFRIDAVAVNAGATANAYIEAPTKGDLVPGRPVLILAEHDGQTLPVFYGMIQSLAPDPATHTVAIICHDVLGRLGETDAVVVPAAHSAWAATDYRVALLEQFEAGPLNLLPNPQFTTDLSGWTFGPGTQALRIVGDAAPGAGDTCAEWYSSQTADIAHTRGRLIGPFTSGQVWTASVWLRSPSGPTTVNLGLGHDHSARTVMQVALTATWQRFTIRRQTTVAGTASSGGAPYLALENGQNAAKTIRVSGAMLSAGPIAWDYVERGTGRGPNLCQQGSFDGGSVNGWYRGFANRVANYGFDADVSGWSTAACGFHVAGATLTWRAEDGASLTGGRAYLSTSAANQGMNASLPGTFRAGVTYQVTAHLYNLSGVEVEVGVGSNGTPADSARVSNSPTSSPPLWIGVSATWTPTADRTDVRVFIMRSAGGTIRDIDQVFVGEFDGQLAVNPYQASWALPAATRGPIERVLDSAIAHVGTQSLRFTTVPEVGCGMVYSLHHGGGYLVGGLDYMLRVWLRASDAMPYRVLLGAVQSGGTDIERRAWWTAGVTGTLVANTWTPIDLPWRPPEDRACSTIHSPWPAIIAVEQTDATARTVWIDEVRLEAGLVAHPIRMEHWELDDEPDQLGTSVSSSSTVLAGLSAMNGVTLSRHWIRPRAVAPWYAYATESRGTAAAKTPVEHVTDATIHALTGVDLDRESIVNMVPAVGDYAVDLPSIARYGLRPRWLGGQEYHASPAGALAVAAALVDRYRDGALRPHLTRRNVFPAQLVRHLGDVLTVESARSGLAPARYSIQTLTTTVKSNVWETELALEEHPY